MQRQPRRRLILGLSGLIILGVSAALLLPLSPRGRFRTPEIGSQADAYFELAMASSRWWCGPARAVDPERSSAI